MAVALPHLHGILWSSPSPVSRSNPARLSQRSIIVIMSQDLSYWDANIEAHLKKSIPIRPPIQVFEPMHHLKFGAPKSTAPSLCIAACELVGGSPDDVITAASATDENKLALIINYQNTFSINTSMQARSVKFELLAEKMLEQTTTEMEIMKNTTRFYKRITAFLLSVCK